MHPFEAAARGVDALHTLLAFQPSSTTGSSPSYANFVTHYVVYLHTNGFEPVLMCACAPLLFATSRNLLNKQVSDVVRECAPSTEEQLRQRITDPKKWEQAKTKELPLNVSPMFNRQTGNCNTYLPGAGNMERLLFVVQSFIAQGMYVVLDYQPMGTEDHAYDLNRFVTQWAQVWKQVTCLPNWGVDIAGRVFVDVMNEPDSMGIRWEANNDHPGAQQLYLATADALWQQTPNQVMFMFEGACKATGQLATVTQYRVAYTTL